MTGIFALLRYMNFSPNLDWSLSALCVGMPTADFAQLGSILCVDQRILFETFPRSLLSRDLQAWKWSGSGLNYYSTLRESLSDQWSCCLVTTNGANSANGANIANNPTLAISAAPPWRMSVESTTDLNRTENSQHRRSFETLFLLSPPTAL
jgi:hypothetical protein